MKIEMTVLLASLLLISCGSSSVNDPVDTRGPGEEVGGEDSVAELRVEPRDSLGVDTLPDTLPDTGPDLTPDIAPDTGVDTLPEVVCVPVCDGLTCGQDDGCGNSCDCDDGDPCTIDKCDWGTGQCSSSLFDGTGPELFDMDLLTDPDTLDVEIISEWTQGFPSVRIQEIRYTSYQYEDCVLTPIRIQAFTAVPASLIQANRTAIGVVKAHGLGGLADLSAAEIPARELDGVVLAYSGPGQGLSEGFPSLPDHLFDTVPDPRDSWFWGHAAAAIRGLTVLEEMDQVNPHRLGMTGYSGGALVTYLVAGVDERVKASVPVSACGFLDVAASAQPVPGWEYNLLQAMTPPRTPESPEFQNFDRWLDPKNYLVSTHGSTLMVDGAQDEFFPINSFGLTFDDLSLSAGPHRSLLIKDFDHGPLALLYGTDDAEEMARDSLTWWFRMLLAEDQGLVMPGQPEVEFTPWLCTEGSLLWECTLVQGTLELPAGLEIESARFNWSIDSALTFFSWNLQNNGGNWVAEVGTLPPNQVNDFAYYVEFQVKGPGGNTMYLTSRPYIPSGFSPNIIPIPQ